MRVPQKQPKRGRLWLNDGSCVRLRPCPNHVWAYRLASKPTHDGEALSGCLTVIDEYTRECLAIQVARQIRSDDVVQLLTDLFVLRGPPEHALARIMARSSAPRLYESGWGESE